MNPVKVAKIAVEQTAFYFDKLFEYLIPASLHETAAVGSRVLVPFGKGNRKRQGIIIEISSCQERELIKPLVAVLEKAPLISREMIELAFWLKSRYYCTMFDALKAMLPAGVNFRMVISYQCPGDIVDLNDKRLCGLNELEKQMMGHFIKSRAEIERDRLLDIMGLEPDNSLPDKLVKMGLILQSDNALTKVSDATVKMARLALPQDEAEELLGANLSPKQAAVVQLLLETGGASVKEICYFTGTTAAVLNTLEKKGIVQFYLNEVFRNPIKQEIPSDHRSIILTEEQQTAFDALLAQYKNGGGNALLYGVTGSGKTQVFMRLVDEAHRDGKSVIVMVPEIALTPQTIAKFYARYGAKVAIIHSGLSMGERLDEWKRIKKGEATIVVGTRSAIFAPCENIGLIIIDEEQEHTYKSEASPRYHARDVARFKCAYHGALLLLCSATPSVESYHAAKEGKYSLHTLKNRYGGALLPDVNIVDMRTNMAESNSTLSNTLLENIESNLQSGHQSILLLNRRGYNTFVSCRSCGHVITCPNCSISLTYHLANHKMMCHYCGHADELPDICPECASDKVRYSGFGTQRIEQELVDKFPAARILRLDTDTTMEKNAHKNKFDSFAAGEYDIMLGTQMVAKGLDFPNVTLVGVVSADQSMYCDDYRSFERAFSLLTQVVGRSGRGQSAGRAIIQTFTPDNPVILLAAGQNYEAFYESEIASRKAMLYPPFCDICQIGFVGESMKQVSAAAKLFLTDLTLLGQQNYPGLPLRVLGPSAAPVPKVSGKYRYRLILKCRDSKRFRAFMCRLLVQFNRRRECREVTVFADLNPESL